MNFPLVETKNLRLVGRTREEVLAEVAGYSEEIRAQVSAAWLELLRNSEATDPWVHGFRMMHREKDVVVGSCGFKGPPDAEGTVEVAYGVDEAHRGNGYATEAAEALVQFALRDPRVRVVRAHTLEDSNASARVLAKSGFRCVGQVVEPEDGLVWRWERRQSV